MVHPHNTRPADTSPSEMLENAFGLGHDCSGTRAQFQVEANELISFDAFRLNAFCSRISSNAPPSLQLLLLLAIKLAETDRKKEIPRTRERS